MKVGTATNAELVGRPSSRWQIEMFSEDDSSVTAPSTLTPCSTAATIGSAAFRVCEELGKRFVSFKGLHIHGRAHVLDQKQRQGVRSHESEDFQIAQGLFILQRLTSEECVDESNAGH